MRIPITRAAGLAAVALATCLALAGAARAQADADPAPKLAPWSGEITPAHLAIAGALRESRGAGAAQGAALLERIVAAGPGTVPAQIDILARGRVPETGPKDAPQILSEPQRELLLAAIGRMPVAEVRQAFEGRLRREPDDPRTRLAAIRLLGLVGTTSDLERLGALAPRKSDDPAVLTHEARDAVSTACAAILRRDGNAWGALPGIVGKAPAGVARPLLAALPGMNDGRSIQVLFSVARSNRALAPEVVGFAARCGATVHGAIDREFSAWIRNELESARPDYATRLLDALGVLDDGESAPMLVERLSDENERTRDSAWRALKSSTGLEFPLDAKRWNLWLHAEQVWHERSRPKLRADLAMRDPRRVVPALRAYGEHRSRRGELATEVAVVLDNSRPELRTLACEVLRTLRAPSVCETLAAHLQDPDPAVAEAVWRTLREITGLEVPREPDRARATLQVR